jgi:hypothetical protein
MRTSLPDRRRRRKVSDERRCVVQLQNGATARRGVVATGRREPFESTGRQGARFDREHETSRLYLESDARRWRITALLVSRVGSPFRPRRVARAHLGTRTTFTKRSSTARSDGRTAGRCPEFRDGVRIKKYGCIEKSAPQQENGRSKGRVRLGLGWFSDKLHRGSQDVSCPRGPTAGPRA